MVDIRQILVMDHDPQSTRVLRSALLGRGYGVHNVRTVESVMECIRRHQADLVILSANSLSFGVEGACRAIRIKSDVAVIVLASCYSEEERIAALEAGADDCLGKPFHMAELLARIRAVLRRLQPGVSRCREQVQLDGIQINLVTRRVTSRGHQVNLTPTEFNLLHYLINNPNIPIPHTRLLLSVWGPEHGGQIEYLRVFVNQLRKKIEPDPAHPRYLLTEPWIGYRFALRTPERTN
jgi:two-component system KDP operon response regulator KdpE